MSTQTTRQRHKRGRTALLVPLVAVALVSCGESTSDSAGDGETGAAPRDIEPVTAVLDFSIDGLHAPLFAAQGTGSYEEAGLNVAIQPSGGSQVAITQVATGQADCGVADAATVVAAQAGEGVDITVVAVLLQNTPASTVTRKDSGITEPKDLIGKSIGISAGSSQTKLLPAFFAANGIDSDQVEQITIDRAAIVGAMLAGKIDAANQFAQTSAKILDQVNIIPWFEHGINSYGSTLICNDDFLEAKPEAARGFVQATVEGLEYTVNNPDEVAQMLTDASNGDLDYFTKELEILMPFLTNPEVEEAGYGTMEESRWEVTQELNMQYLDQTKELPLEEIFTEEYLASSGG